MNAQAIGLGQKSIKALTKNIIIHQDINIQIDTP